MQDGNAIPADAAGEWLRKSVTDPAAQISITWEVTERNDAVYEEVLSILFGPNSDDMAA
jgi:hypothetical protein